jgi:hypothetical protein
MIFVRVVVASDEKMQRLRLADILMMFDAFSSALVLYQALEKDFGEARLLYHQQWMRAMVALCNIGIAGYAV